MTIMMMMREVWESSRRSFERKHKSNRQENYCQATLSKFNFTREFCGKFLNSSVSDLVWGRVKGTEEKFIGILLCVNQF